MGTPLIHYTNRDFETIKAALVTHIQTAYPDTWKNFYESGLGMAWLELVAYCFDVLSFYLDFTANEAFLPTARDRDSLVNLCKLIGYPIRPATSAGVTCTATIGTPQAADVLIPAGTTVTTGAGVVFTVLTDQRVPAGAVEASASLSEGSVLTDNFTSNGATFQRFKTTNAEVVSGSLAVLVNGEEWDQIASLVYGDSTTRCFALEYDDEDYGYICFGDGTSGAIPPLGAAIGVQYRVGGGVKGNISLNEINTDVQGVLEGSTPPTYITVHLLNDKYRGSGGEERETNDHIRFWAPLWVRTNGRAVTLDDFNTLGNTFVSPTWGSPAYVSAKIKQEVPELNTVELHVWARDSYGNIVAPSAGLKQALYNYFMNNDAGAVRIICTDVEVLDGDIAYIDVAIQVRVDSNYAAVGVTNDINTAVINFFNSSDIRPGWDVRLSRLYSTIQAVTGVSFALIKQMTASQKLIEYVGIGDGITTNFVDTLTVEPGLPIVPFSVSITSGTLAVTDDGDGGLIGSVDPAGTNTIDYETGALDVTFSSAPANGATITAEYRTVLDYQRGGAEQTANGVDTRFTGVLSYAPVVPGTMAFSDGEQDALDDGNGNLVGDVNPLGENHIDYDTGAYDFTLNLPPANGTIIYSTYRQLLQSASHDIPIGREQLAVRSIITIETLETEE